MGRNNAVLDIGSSKVIFLICSAGGTDGQLVVHGAGIREYGGYSGGMIADVKQLSDAIVDALTIAESEARHKVKEISVGVPAPFLKVVSSEAELALTKRERRIGFRTVDELMELSLEFDGPDGFELMHSTPVEFTVDGKTRADTPIGVTAERVSAVVSHVFVDSAFKRMVSDALVRVGLDADMFIGVPLSEGIFVIPEQERAGGAVLVDSGYTHTDVCLIKGAALMDVRSIGAGGAHFTGDIAYGLGIDRGVAENIKRRYVYSLDYQDTIDIVRLQSGGTIRVDHEVIQYIIEARSKELAGLIAEAMKDMGVGPEMPVYLTGGGISLMRGSCEYLERCLSRPVYVRMPWMPRLSSPNYASAFSVMNFVVESADEDNPGRLAGVIDKARLKRRIKEFFIK